jgi:hypothetical protein
MARRKAAFSKEQEVPGLGRTAKITAYANSNHAAADELDSLTSLMSQHTCRQDTTKIQRNDMLTTSISGPVVVPARTFRDEWPAENQWRPGQELRTEKLYSSGAIKKRSEQSGVTFGEYQLSSQQEPRATPVQNRACTLEKALTKAALARTVSLGSDCEPQRNVFQRQRSKLEEQARQIVVGTFNAQTRQEMATNKNKHTVPQFSIATLNCGSGTSAMQDSPTYKQMTYQVPQSALRTAAEHSFVSEFRLANKGRQQRSHIHCFG